MLPVRNPRNRRLNHRFPRPCHYERLLRRHNVFRAWFKLTTILHSTRFPARMTYCIPLLFPTRCTSGPPSVTLQNSLSHCKKHETSNMPSPLAHSHEVELGLPFSRKPNGFRGKRVDRSMCFPTQSKILVSSVVLISSKSNLQIALSPSPSWGCNATSDPKETVPEVLHPCGRPR